VLIICALAGCLTALGHKTQARRWARDFGVSERGRPREAEAWCWAWDFGVCKGEDQARQKAGQNLPKAVLNLFLECEFILTGLLEN